MSNQHKLYLGTFLACLLGGSAWLKFNEPTGEASAHSLVEGTASSSKSRHSLAPSVDWQHQTRQSLLQEDSSNFAQMIKRLGHDELSDIAMEIYASFEKDPEATAKWLEQVSLELAEDKEHPQATKLLSLLPFTKEVPDIERKVFHSWLEESPEKLFTLMSDRAAFEEVDDHRLSILASVLQNESADLFENYLSWADGTENPVLKGMAIQKVVTHLDSENVEKVGDIISRNLENGPIVAALFDYVGKHSPEDRNKTLDWISSLQTRDLVLKAQVFGRLIQQIATEDVDQATELLSADDFLKKYYDDSQESVVTSDGEWSHSAQGFFDTTLESFIKGAMFTDMELARNSAESFFNPELKNAYLELLNSNLEPKPPGSHQCEFCDKEEAHTH